MFTGLIQETAQVTAKSDLTDSGFNLSVTRPKTFESLKLGESIALDGVCLTLTQFQNDSMSFFVGRETLNKTNFSNIKVTQRINLERSLSVGDRLGGHFVSGHIDGTAKVLSATHDGQCLSLSLAVSPEQFKFIIPKGSLCVNGVSLTVNAVDRDTKTVDLYLIPETLERTNLGALRVDATVNIECDQFVKIIAYQLDRNQNEQHL